MKEQAVLVGARWRAWRPGRSSPAEAQTAGYREYFFGRQESVDIDDSGVVATPGPNRMIVVPPGYEVAGGGAGTVGHVLFCRR